MRTFCKKVSSRPTDLFASFCWNDSACSPFPAASFPSAYGSLPPASLPPVRLRLPSACAPYRPAAPFPFTHLLFQSLPSHTFCSCLEIFSTTNKLCYFWHSKFQQVKTYAFCSWYDIFTQKWNCSSPNNLCKCTESPSTLSTNTFIVWNLYLSWSNHPVLSLRLELNVGSFSEHQNKTSGTDTYKVHFFTARISQVNANTMKRIFEQ